MVGVVSDTLGDMLHYSIAIASRGGWRVPETELRKKARWELLDTRMESLQIKEEGKNVLCK